MELSSSHSKLSLSAISFALINFLLVLPAVLILGFGLQLEIDLFAKVFSSETLGVVFSTLEQSLVSTLLSLLAGIFSVLCFWNLPVSTQRKTKDFLLLPSVLPSLFVVVAVGGFGDLMDWSLYGFWGVIFAHVLINTGLVAAGLHIATHSKAKLLQQGLIEGAGSFKLRRVWLHLVKPELLSLGFLVFSFCFTSFSIPVLLAGAKPLSLEVYMFQQIKISGSYSFALCIGLLQLLFFLVLSKLFSKESSVQTKENVESLYFLSIPARWLPFLPIGLLSFSFVVSCVFGVLQLLEKPEFLQISLQAAVKTLQQGLWATASFFALFYLSLLLSFKQRVWVKGLMPLGYGVTGIGFLLLPFEGFGAFKVGFGLTLLFFPFLFRGYIFDGISALEKQRVMAKTLGASDFAIASQVLVPQLYQPLKICLLLLCLWAFSDYGLSLFVLSADSNLGLMASTLMGSYRIDMASALTAAACALGFAYYIAFDRLVLRFLCRQ